MDGGCGWRRPAASSPPHFQANWARERSSAKRSISISPPADLDPVAMLEEHLSVGWEYHTEVLIEQPAGSLSRWLPRALGRLEPVDDVTCRLVGTTSNPIWYAEQLAVVPRISRVVGGPELRSAVRALGERLAAAAR